MGDIDLIYYNHLGTSFYLKRGTINKLNKIQLVFNSRALHLSKDELFGLKDVIKTSLTVLDQLGDTVEQDSTIGIKLDGYEEELCVNLMELKVLEDLICGTLFHMNFDAVISDLIRG